jgi:hypothetical protein
MGRRGPLRGGGVRGGAGRGHRQRQAETAEDLQAQIAERARAKAWAEAAHQMDGVGAPP